MRIIFSASFLYHLTSAFLNISCFFIGEKIKIEGIVIDEPNIKDDGAQLTVLSDSEKVLVNVGLFPEYKYGDLVEISGKLEKPANIATTTGNDFDYVKFLAKDDIFYEISFAQAKIISS
ncbi:MAG: DUF4131 domain-containing protein, partial [Actinomycetota bacterium]